jgi:hypothetical protein
LVIFHKSDACPWGQWVRACGSDSKLPRNCDVTWWGSMPTVNLVKELQNIPVAWVCKGKITRSELPCSCFRWVGWVLWHYRVILTRHNSWEFWATVEVGNGERERADTVKTSAEE